MQFVIISGMSGAGKSRAASDLEDLGFYCVDNMPAEMIPQFAQLCLATKGRYEKVALVTDIRASMTFDALFQALQKLDDMHLQYSIYYIEASTAVIIKRYKETRRLHPLMKDFGVSKALVCTYQAISGAGKTFDRMPEIVDNVIPYIGGEEEKSEREPLKLWGHIEGDQIVNAEKPTITAQCFRVPVSDGHTAAVFVSFDKKPTKEQMLEAWANFRGPAQELNLPSAPKQFLHYFTEPDRPQPKLDRNTENGMAVCIGRLREDTLFDYKFACMSHNTLRGAAGGAVLLAELLAAKGYFD